MAERLPTVASQPYPFPFDGAWRAADTAVLLLGFAPPLVSALGAEPALAKAVVLSRAARLVGLAVLASCRAGEGVMPALAVTAADALVHPGHNAFYGTDLEARLRARGVRNLLFAGLPTDGLVHATMRSANDMGFEGLLVSDACHGTSPERHAAQLRITTFGNGLFGTVASLDAVLAALTAPQGSA